MKVVFFAPHAAIWVHAFPEALVAEALAQHGHDVLYVTCGGTFSNHCVAMSAYRCSYDAPAERKAEVCKRCNLNRDVLRRELGLRSYDIAAVLGPDDLAEADRVLSGVTQDNFLHAQLEGVEYGRAALSTFLLVHKKMQLRFAQQEWQILLGEMRNTLLSLIAARKIFAQEKPDRLVLYSPGYSVNLVWARLAERHNVPQYYIQAGNNLSDRLKKMTFARGLYWQGLMIEAWPRFRDVPCDQRTARYVADHFVELFRGQSFISYSLGRAASAGLDIRARYGVRPGQKLLVATMSSYDELMAGEITGQMPKLDRGVFPTQADWVRALLRFIAAREDLFLLIRVHPREFPNRRDSVKSQHAAELEKILADLPPNARVNWPADGISLYHLMEEMDVCLNAWSSVGKEMATLGIPVVVYSRETCFYTPEINYVASDEPDYFRLIELALRDGWRFENVRAGFRWFALEDLYARIDLGESVSLLENVRPTLHMRARRRLLDLFSPIHSEVSDCRGRAKRLRMSDLIARVIEEGRNSLLEVLTPADLGPRSLAEEDRALRQELRRLAEALYGPRLEAPGGKLKANLLRVLGGGAAARALETANAR
jgi:hypothetical protein